MQVQYLKRHTLFVILIAALSIFIAACSDDDDNPTNPGGGGTNLGSGTVKITYHGTDSLTFSGSGTWPPSGNGVATAMDSSRTQLQLVGYAQASSASPKLADPQANFSYVIIFLNDTGGISTGAYSLLSDDVQILVGIDVDTNFVDSMSYYLTNGTLTVTSVTSSQITATFSGSGFRPSDGDTITINNGSLTANYVLGLFLDVDDSSGTECTSLANNAPTVTDIRVTGSLPTGAGGTIVDGTYYLTQYQRYSSDSLRTRKITARLSGNTIEAVIQNGSDPEERVSGTFVSDSASASILIFATCPQVGSLPFDHYTASGNSLMLISTTEQTVLTFTRQP